MSQQTTIRQSVAIPLLKSLISAILLAAVAMALYALSLQVTGWRVFWGVASASALISWLIFIRAEPGQSSKPNRVYSNSTKVQVIARDPAGAYSAGVFAEFPLDIKTLARAARAINSGADFSHAGMAGKYKPLSRSEFEALRDECIARGLAYWIDEDCHNLGVRLTLAGEAMFKKIEQVHKRSLTSQLDRLPVGQQISERRAYTHTLTQD